ncbi:hypothetical protein [Kribbella sp. NPDC051620]|uniref:hypothetical protein n=1 Tax=Kribbella sp. NPDC051620 TaxID=3364120 RepID=UPI0037A7F57D
MIGSVLPIGHYAGRRVHADQVIHTVRVGRELHQLPGNAFGLWSLSHDAAVLTEAELGRYADRLGISDARSLLDWLVSAGLIVTPGPTAEEFARGHRLGVLFVGLGNSLEEPDRYAVGLPSLGPAAVLDPGRYELWQWGSTAPSLWACCETRASARGCRPEDVVDGLLADLKYLTSHGCAYLDVVR